GGVLTVEGAGAYLVNQRFIDFSNNMYFRALNSNNVFSEWIKIASESNPKIKTKSITNAIDFDTYKTEGSYAIAHDLIATSTNKPIGAVGGVLTVEGAGAYLVNQRFIDFSNNMYFRALNSNNVFSEWIKIENPISPLKNKKWLAIGDSITVGYGSNNKSYADILATKHNAILTKLASSGSTINGGINMPDNQTLSKLIDSLTSDQNFDLITIAAGTNDPFDRAFGVFEDRTRDTFYGSLHYMMIQLKSKFPNARMLFISQIPRVNLRSLHDKTSALDIKFKAISEVCDYYSVPIFVGHRNFGFHPDDNTEFKNKYMPDGLHPNDAGQIWYANRLENSILQASK
ncbi:SGNH/GDSL hydrolase family protein, partial [Acinetobacter sp. YH12043]|uniref:SGNH/GDSL hydrolase family protein n=1 Tax=Acinetobacter sp. YH12043 TaxID=2601050 RepID=UPI0015D1F01C